MPSIQIYDTTLRDGTQAEGIALSCEDKIKIAQHLDKMGIHYIEGGYPGSNPKDVDFFSQMRHYKFKHARLVGFGSTRRAKLTAESDANLNALVNSGVSTAAIFGKSWDMHVTKSLGTTLEENLAMIRDTVAFLKRNGLEVIFDAEHFFDGYKANPEYALAALAAAEAGGASTLALCDTNGGTMPLEIKEIVELVAQKLRTPLGIHAHNDSELAVANSLMAVQSGAIQVQGTINGYGERCGNANLCSIIPNLSFKLGYETIPRENLSRLVEMSRYVSEVANVSPDSRQPYVGASAFAHKGGIHVSAILKDSKTYEHIDPELVGNQRRVLISELSGISNLLYKYKEMNLDIDRQNPESKRILEEIKQLENQGFQFEGAEGTIELLLHKAHSNFTEPFSLEALRLLVEMKPNSPAYSEAVIKIRVGEQVVHTAAEGNGPVNALDHALRKSLKNFYPNLEAMQLNDYKVRVLDEKDGTGASVRVHIETGNSQDSWGTVGVSPNIIEASWQALADSIAYGLMKEESAAAKDKGTEPEIK